MSTMLKKMTRPISLLLVLVMMLSFFVGCAEEETVEVPVIVPAEQLMSDEYEVNEDINNEMSYYIDYLRKYKTDGTFSNKMLIVQMFSMFKIQIDDWESIVLGSASMGDITALIEDKNVQYVNNKTQAVIDERQALIDKEYNEAKEKAEASGKEYNKAKKEVYTEDIKFDKPYTYKLYLGKIKSENAKSYEPTRLIDSSKNKTIYMVVSKYGIPYVQFEFAKVNNVFNTGILQESDWIVNGVKAANVSSYGMSSDGKTKLENPPEFVDVDGLNKAAKKNMVMSGNIPFGGDGFTWESLNLLCEALELTEGANEHGFKKTSDKQFTYYTIVLGTNMFESDDSLFDESKMVMPYTTLVATFDPLTQVCVNWTIDMNSRTENYKQYLHSLTRKIDVNVREFQQDTTDYEGRRQTIKNWIDDHSANASSAFVAYVAGKDGEEKFGIVDTGLKNLHIEPTIDGVKYSTIELLESEDGTDWVGDFISLEDLERAYQQADTAATEEYIAKHTKTFIIRNTALDAEGNVVGVITPDSPHLKYTVDNGVYYIVESTMVDGHPTDVKTLTTTQIDELFYTYATTYRLKSVQYDEMINVFNTNGVLAAREYVTNLFAQAEQDQKNQGILPGVTNNKVNMDNKIVYKENTTSKDINMIIINGKSYSIQDMTKNFFTDRGYEESGLFNYNVSTLYNIDGKKLSYDGNMALETVCMAKNDFIDFFGTNDEAIRFINGVHVGMSDDEAIEALANLNPDDVITENGSLLVVTTEEYNLVVVIEVDRFSGNSSKPGRGEDDVVVEKESFVTEIHLIRELLSDDVVNEDDVKNPDDVEDPTDDDEKPDDGDDEDVGNDDGDEDNESDDDENVTDDGDDEDTSDDEKDDEKEEKPSGGGLAAILATLGIVLYIGGFAIGILMLVVQWRIFVKAGEAGWKILIPFYNMYIFYKISMGRGIFFLSWIIPPVGAILTLIATYRLFQKFGKSVGFCIAGIFFSPIMMLIVAFDGSAYEGVELPESMKKKPKEPKAPKASRNDAPVMTEQGSQDGAATESAPTPPPAPMPKKPAPKSSRFGKKSNPKDEGAFK